MAEAKVADMSRDELEAEDARLAKERTATRLRQVEVSQRLDAYRELDRLNIDPARLQEIARVAKIEAKSETAEEQA